MAEKKNICDAVFEKIQKQHITPKARWRFLVKNMLVWALGIASILVGALTVAVLIFSLVNSDWSQHIILHESLMAHIMSIMPHIWVLLFAFFIVAVYFNLRHTKKGYRFALPVLILISLVLTLVVGIVYYVLGVGHFTEYLSGKYIPGYTSFLEKKEAMWMHPERGVLGGWVLSYETSGDFQLEDFDGKVWFVLGRDLVDKQKELLERMGQIGVFGTQIEESVFSACFIRPWTIYGQSEIIAQQKAEHMRARKEFLEQHGLYDAKKAAVHRLEEKVQEHRQNVETYERKMKWLRNNGCEIGQSTINH